MQRVGATYSETFHWTFEGPLERVWMALADTERFNEAAKLPVYAITEDTDADGHVTFHARAKVGGIDLAWEEIPTNWVHNAWFEHGRRFSKGPLKSLTARLELWPTETGCAGDYTLTAEPRTWFGHAMMYLSFFSATKTNFTKLARDADAFATGAANVPFEVPPVSLGPDAATLFERARQAWPSQASHLHGVRDRLIRHLRETGDVDARRIRPLALAEVWQTDETETIATAFEAARSGLLGTTWDLLCPRCQGAKVSVAALDELPREAHCGSCNITYGRDFAKNVELSFYPSRQVRDLPDGEFCLYGPMTTPHVYAQVTLAPGETRTIASATLPAKRLRMRTLEPGPEGEFDPRAAVAQVITVTPDMIRAEAMAPGAGDGATLSISNTRPRDVTLVLDGPVWSRNALTADRVLAMQSFRDVFDDALLRPGDHLNIDQATIMFVDLKGSTQLYEDVGDAAAYRLVREFFAEIAAAARAHEGAVIKTIGDAVNLSFVRPAMALRCARAIHIAFAAHNAALPDDTPRTECKTGIHVGRTIAVTLNRQLDYYGTAVNLAARLCDYADPGEIVISDAMCAAPGVADMLAGAAATTESATLKGFAAPVEVRRITDVAGLGAALPPTAPDQST